MSEIGGISSINDGGNLVNRSPTNGNNIYNSWNLKKVRRDTNRRSNRRHIEANNPQQTGTVPSFYNQRRSNSKNRNKRLEGFMIDGDDDSVFSDNGSSASGEQSVCSSGSRNSIGGHMDLFKKSNLLSDNKVHEDRYQDKNRNRCLPNSVPNAPNYLSQFQDLTFDNPSDPVAVNSAAEQQGNLGLVARSEMERDLALKGNYSCFDDNADMTYGVVSKNNFVHNNMVPYFNSGPGKGYGPNSIFNEKLNDVHQRKLERFSGSTKNIEYRPKTERRPLFNPQVGLTNMYGMPSLTNYMESRFIPGRERRNERLHQPVRVTPGLNKGYNEISTEGFNDSYRPLPKTVDELRVATDPKVSYRTPIIPGMKAVKRGIIPNVAKQRPSTFTELDPRDWVKSLGYYRAPTVYGNVNAPATNRQMTTKEWFSSAKLEGSLPTPESMLAKIKVSHKENFLAPAPRNVTGVSRDKSYAFDYKNNVPDPTQRNLTENVTWLAAPGPNTVKQTYAWDTKTNIPDQTQRNLTENLTWLTAPGPSTVKQSYAWDPQSNIPDPNMRNLTENQTWLTGPGPNTVKQSYAWDPVSNIPDPNMRNLTENQTWLTGPGPNTVKQSYAWDPVSNIPDPNMRNLTENVTWLAGAGPNTVKQSYAWDPVSNIPDPTMRNLTENVTWLAGAGPNTVKQSYAWDPVSNIPDPTQRNLTENKTWLTGPGPNTVKQSYAWDPVSNIPDPTMRNLTENNTRLNAAAPNGLTQSYAIDYVSSIPDPTMRNLTENKTWLTGPGPNSVEKAYAFDYITSIPDPTMRNLTEKITRLNPAQQHGAERAMTRNDADNMLVNVAKEKLITIRDGGQPVPSNYSKIPTFEHTMVQLAEPIQINRDIYANMTANGGNARPLQCIPTMYSRIANVLPELSWRFDTCVKSNLATNPLINNTQHKSVDYNAPR